MMTTAWDATDGLGFTAAVPVVDVPKGYGVYNVREGTVYKVGEPIILYAEPFGYGYGTAAAGVYTIGFDVDLRVLGADGTVVAEAPGVLALGTESRHKNREFMADMTFNCVRLRCPRWAWRQASPCACKTSATSRARWPTTALLRRRQGLQR